MMGNCYIAQPKLQTTNTTISELLSALKRVKDTQNTSEGAIPTVTNSHEVQNDADERTAVWNGADVARKTH